MEELVNKEVCREIGVTASDLGKGEVIISFVFYKLSSSPLIMGKLDVMQ